MPAHTDGVNLELTFEPAIASIIERVSGVANRHGVPCFLVGGSVRDAVLRRPILDLDVLIDSGNQAGMTAEQFADAASRALRGLSAGETSTLPAGPAARATLRLAAT